MSSISNPLPKHIGILFFGPLPPNTVILVKSITSVCIIMTMKCYLQLCHIANSDCFYFHAQLFVFSGDKNCPVLGSSLIFSILIVNSTPNSSWTSSLCGSLLYLVLCVFTQMQSFLWPWTGSILNITLSCCRGAILEMPTLLFWVGSCVFLYCLFS